MVIFHSYLSLPEGTSYQSSQQKLREEFMLQASKIWCQSRFPIFSIFQPFKLGQTQKHPKKKTPQLSTTFKSPKKITSSQLQWFYTNNFKQCLLSTTTLTNLHNPKQIVKSDPAVLHGPGHGFDRRCPRCPRCSRRAAAARGGGPPAGWRAGAAGPLDIYIYTHIYIYTNTYIYIHIYIYI